MNSYMVPETVIDECVELDSITNPKPDSVKKPRWAKAVQEYYPDNFANCFGCGRNNDHGLHTKTFWDAEKEEGICRPKPSAHHCGYKGVFHGGLLSSVIECNSVATSIAATYEKEDLDPNVDLVFYVLGSIINTHFICPVPIDAPDIVVKTKVLELKPKKARCQVSVYANDVLCTSAETIAVRVPTEIINAQFIAENS